MTYFHPIRSNPLTRLASPALLIAMTLGLAACSSASEEAAAEPEMASDPDREVAGGSLPDGWSVRSDRSDGSDINMSMDGNTYHFMMGSAGTFYNPAWTADGDRSFSATLVQTAAPSHPISYGLMIGGMNMDADDQMYTYYLTRLTGEYFIANRDGENVTKVVDWTASDALNPQADDGTQTNTLGIEVAGTEVIFTANGEEVTRLPAADLHTSGMYGFRIGHNLDVDVMDVSN